MYKLQRVFLLGQLVAMTALPNADLANIDYKELKYWFMRSSGINQTNIASEKEVAATDDKPDFSLPIIDEQARKLMMYDVLQSNSDQSKPLSTLHRDLEVFCGDGAHPEANLAQITDRTLSAAGAAVHRAMLAHPVGSFDLEKLRARQALIRAFIENEELLIKADELCKIMANNDERLLSNWLDIDAVSSKVIEQSYFQAGFLKDLNTSPLAMEVWTRLGHVGMGAQLMTEYIASIVGMAGSGYLTEKYMGTNPDASLADHLLFSFSQVNKALSYVINPFKGYAASCDLLAETQNGYDLDVRYGRMSQAQADFAIKGLKVGMYGVLPVYVALILGLKAYQTKQLMEQAFLTRDAINFLQARLIGLGTLVRSVQALEQLADVHPELAAGLVSWQHAAALLHSTEQDDFATLVHMLQTNTFTGEASFFSLSGRVLAAHQLAVQERDSFAGAIALMGELDACVSAAKLYKQFEKRRVHFCFANITQTRKPHMILQSFWNPFVDYKTVVVNDLELGGGRAQQHVVLTGSNTGGKSTVGLKGTLINLYFAHTFGLAPADVCDISAFTDFSSYLHVVDDVASGESAFQAEINRANSLLKAVKNLHQDQFAFIVIDELFKGTSPEKGAPGARKVIQHLAGYDNVIFIIATHFKELTSIAAEIDSVVNMKIEIFEDEAGNLIKPYKLEEGISECNVADNLMDAGLDLEKLSIA